MNLTLQSWDPSSARQPIPELERLEYSSSCWVGSVSTANTLAFSEFLSHARKGDLENLARFQQVGGDLAYAVILRMRDDLWRLLVIRSPENPQQNEDFVLSSTVRANVRVEEEQQRLVDIEASLKPDLKIRFRDIIKEWLRF